MVHGQQTELQWPKCRGPEQMPPVLGVGGSYWSEDGATLNGVSKDQELETCARWTRILELSNIHTVWVRVYSKP